MPRILLGHTITGELSEGVSGSYNHRKAVAGALKKAVLHGWSVYDSIYVVLAVEAEAQLVTADEKLANALAGHLPVKWLGAI